MPTDSLTSSYSNDILDDDFNTLLNVLDSEKIVAIFDSCNSGGFINDVGKDLSASGRVILTACAENENSTEFSALGHSIFSYYVIEALNSLESVDVNANHEVSAEEIFNYANTEVLSWTLDFQHQEIV